MGKVIGKQLNHGFAGSFSRMPDMIINTRVAEGNEIQFGRALMRGTNGNQVKLTDATTTMTNFVGFAGKEVKTAFDFESQDVGVYRAGEAVPCFQRGSINVICAEGDPKTGDAVYLALTTSAFTGAKVGDLFAGTPSGQEDTDYIVLTNCQWGGTTDSNSIAELVVLTRANA